MSNFVFVKELKEKICYDLNGDNMKTNFRKIDKTLFFCMIFMFSFGLLMIFSASSVKASLLGEPYYYFLRQLFPLIVSLGIFMIIIRIPISFFKKYAHIYLVAILLALVFVTFYGVTINQSQRWIDLGFYMLQPSEFAKTALIIFMASYYGKNKDSKNGIVILLPMIIAAIIFALTYIQPDLGTALIIFFITGSLFLLIPSEQKYKKMIIQVMSIIVVGFFIVGVFTGFNMLKTHQKDRLDFTNPCSKYLTGGSGYQVCNGLIAINNGGLFGVGLGNSTQKYLYLPEPHTDFIFPIVVEELGLIVSSFILLVYALILIRIVRIGNRTKDLGSSIICYGAALMIFAHLVINLGGALALMPLTGAPLPFISYGSSFALNLMIILALVQRVEIENKKRIQRSLLK